jgi:processive 1,2-diacylglycerol beta-glucosyltransferase
VIVNPIPGPEERNAAILMKEGAAVYCRDHRALGAAVDELLGEPERLARMRQAVTRIARPHAASEIVDVVACSPLERRPRRVPVGVC